MTVSESEVRKDMALYEEKIKNSIFGGWNEYLSYDSHARSIYKARTRANIVHDLTVFHARSQFENIKGVHFIETRGIFLISIQDKYLLRFKMLDNNKKYKNVQTQHTKDFYNQKALPKIPPAIRLIAGYELNSLETGIKSIDITCPNGVNNHWYYGLTGRNQDTLFDFPLASTIYDTPSDFQLKETEKKRGSNEQKN